MLFRSQARKLTQLLQTAVKHSPWHAERILTAGLDVGANCAPVTLEQLRRLPVMTKQDATTAKNKIEGALEKNKEQKAGQGSTSPAK